jgi:hypothetical protein
MAGLSSSATLRAVPAAAGGRAAEVVALIHGGRTKEMVVPARDLVQEFAER